MITATIPSEFEPFIQFQLATGRYQSTEDIVSDALRLLQNQNLENLQKEIQVGIDELDRGEAIVIDDERGLRRFFEDIESEVRAEIDAERSG